MYSEKKTRLVGEGVDVPYNSPMQVPVVEPFHSRVLSSLGTLRERMWSINSKLTEVAGSSGPCDTCKHQEPSCLTEDIMFRLNELHGVVDEIQDKLNRVI